MHDPANESDRFTIDGQLFDSRLLLDIGYYRDPQRALIAARASGAEIICVSVRRNNLGQRNGEANLLDTLTPDEFMILPSSSGCYNAEDAIACCRQARELLNGQNLVKLEVIGDEQTLYPDIAATLSAAQTLIDDGFRLLVYCNDDPVIARRLEAMGAAALMPMGAPPGSRLTQYNPGNLRRFIDQASIPVLLGGICSASDAALAMELGCDAVVIDRAIAHAQEPVLMAQAMCFAVQAGRLGYLAD
ncbi:thiazole synthase [Marinobacterium sedimentorum]|uniref:thiazole synthase n=1 Tax=Marinobacterium sedimentorum TaxID=2927804 RepID=UPI0020C6CF5E|nr:thiazole synthase [Marinobacterium sedimentorum]MCP8688755.1 thiazole synthase [Marinobacterium sedimentorum]